MDLHKISASKTREQAIEGVIEGLLKLNQTTTWRAKHFGFWHQLKIKITEFEKPNYFTDEMISGSFRHMKHKHEFILRENKTVMVDTFEFSLPFGIIGWAVDKLILYNYMSKFLKTRNKVIKDFAESEKWKLILDN